MQGNLRVHIAPLGFEVDRIVLPLERTRADRLWLLRHSARAGDVSAPYYDRIGEWCKKNDVEFMTESADRMDLFDLMRSIRHIIERERGNVIYVNASSGSKIQAIACMMACMTLSDGNLRPFYAEPEGYGGGGRSADGQQSYGLRDMKILPIYEIRTPPERLLKALKIISMQDGGTITKKDMAKLADQNRLISVNAANSNTSQARFASLESNIISPLEREWGFVAINKIGRNRHIMLTEDGRNAARFLLDSPKFGELEFRVDS